MQIFPGCKHDVLHDAGKVKAMESIINWIRTRV